MERLTTTCLISNFNYARFVCDAVDGALNQSMPFDEIIVVDDGSTDGSIELLRERYGRTPQVKIVEKEHGGQLSCFNAGAARATGDIVFFLDADDVFEPNYVEQALATFAKYPSCDFLFCGRRLFGQQDEIVLPFAEDRDFGYSVLRTAYLREWIGAATSCLSIRRNLLERFLPLPLTDEWRVRADDCLIFAASLARGRKRYLAQPLVRYRVHGGNAFRGRKSDPSTTYCRRFAINRLFEHLERKLCYNVVRLAEIHHREFCTIDTPTIRELLSYLRIGTYAQVSPLRRAGCALDMLRHYVRRYRERSATKASGATVQNAKPPVAGSPAPARTQQQAA